MSKSYKKTPRKFDDDFIYGVDDVDIRDKHSKNRDERRATKEFLKDFESNDQSPKDRKDYR